MFDIRGALSTVSYAIISVAAKFSTDLKQTSLYAIQVCHTLINPSNV